MTLIAADTPAVLPPHSPASRMLALIRACRLAPDDPVVAVGDVEASLIVALRDLGQVDVSVLHPSLEHLQRLRADLGDLEQEVLLIETDVPSFHPGRRYALWLDSGFFHRLRYPEERHRYVQMLQFALRPEGHLVITTSGPEGPQHDQGHHVERYSASRLEEELGGQFELIEHTVDLHTDRHGHSHELLHARFQRHAPVCSG